MVPCGGTSYSTLCAQSVQVPQTQTVPVTTTVRHETGGCKAETPIDIVFAEPRSIAIRVAVDACEVAEAPTPRPFSD